MDTLTASTALKPQTSLTSTGFAPLAQKSPASIFSGINSSTPAVMGSQLAPKIDPQAVAQAQSQAVFPSSIKPTSTGGISFNPSMASGYSAPATTQTSTATLKPDLNSFIIQNNPTPNGGTVTTTGANPSGYTPAQGFSIDTSSPIPSSALSGNYTSADLSQSHNQYSDYVNALAQAQGYSPDYVQAYQAQQQAQLQGATLNSNFYTGNNLPGDTLSYAQGATAKAEAQNTLQQTEANIALNTQQLARTGNIASAQTQLQYAPAAVAGQNAINQYNALQQQYPNASIPEYNNSLSPALNQQIAQELVANSPAYRAQFQSQYQTAAGGTGIYNKLDTGGLQQNSDGTISLVSDAAKALGAGQSASVQSNIDIYNKLAPAYKAANDDFTALTSFMQNAGLNQSNVPILNQVQNAVNAKVLDPGAVGAYNSYIQSLRSNYANLLAARTGSVAGVNDEANSLIPNNLTVSQLQLVKDALNANGQNILNATQQQIQQGLGSLQGNSSFTGNSSLSGGGLYDF